MAAARHSAKDWLDRPMTSWHLILAVFVLLLGFGLLMVLSASSISALKAKGSAFATFGNQAFFAVIGLGSFIFAARVSPRYLRRLAFPAVVVAVALLGAVLQIGQVRGGARSWIGVGALTFQPSELAKVALLIWMAHVLAARRNSIRSLKSLLFPVVPIFLLMVGLIMLQPDLGTTVSLSLVFFAVLWFAGAPMWIFGLLAVGGIAGFGYLAISASYRLKRVLSFLDPWNRDLLNDTYQVRQAWYGMGHGGIFGAGLGQSMVKWAWLPNADSDFIFAIIGEELGLIGSCLVVLLFGLLGYTGLRIARRSVDPFNKIVAASATVWLVGQAAINIGYVVGLLPVTGIPLPMISAGGTSLVVTMMVFGLLANLARREPQAAAALYAQGPGRVARFLGVGVTRPGETRPPSRRQVRRTARIEQRTAERAERRRLAAERAQTTQRRPQPDRNRRRSDPRQHQTRRQQPDSRRQQQDARRPQHQVPERRAGGSRPVRSSPEPRTGGSRPVRGNPADTAGRPTSSRRAATPPRRQRATPASPPPLRRDGDRPSRFGDQNDPRDPLPGRTIRR